MSIEIKQLSKTFPNGFKAVHEVSFKMETGSLVAVLGPSGSGKSTLLRMIAGLEIPDAGEILLTGREATVLSARERGVGREEAMREYLAWEIDLVNQMAEDDDQRFRVVAG